MTAINLKASVLAIVPEVTEGTPKFPTAATDYTALQSDFSMAPSYDVLENDELRSSIGMAKSILGAENPTASFSHYLRHSGVEGSAPDYNDLVKSCFGAEAVAGTEYDTVSSSTVAAIKVDTAEGANFRRGQAVLVKHATGANEIRPIHSISTDDLIPGFDLAAAPASGVNLGKAVTYYPTDAGHQTLTMIHYTGNGGAIQLMAGGRVTEMSIDFSAGDLINCSYSIEGLSYKFNPIEITAATKYLDFTDDNGTFAAILEATVYSDPHALAAAVTAAMNTVQTVETHSCVYSDSTGKFTIATSTSTLLTLKWATGTNTANTIGTKLGFLVAADDSSATSYAADAAISFASPYTPTLDSADPVAAKDNRCMLGDHDDNVCFAASTVSVSIANTKADIMSICATSGKSGSIVSAREVTISVSALLDKYDSDKYRRFRENAETRFCYIFGTKAGSNWVAGKCGCLYVPTATITSVELTDVDGMVQVDMELKAFVDSSGNGEVYLSFV